MVNIPGSIPKSIKKRSKKPPNGKVKKKPTEDLGKPIQLDPVRLIELSAALARYNSELSIKYIAAVYPVPYQTNKEYQQFQRSLKVCINNQSDI